MQISPYPISLKPAVENHVENYINDRMYRSENANFTKSKSILNKTIKS